MDKKMKVTLIVIAIILLTFAIIIVIYSQFKTKPVNTNVIGDLVLNDANTGLENILNDILDDENTENEEKDKNTENINNSQNSEKNNKEDEIQDDNQLTPKQKKAVELAEEAWKKEWGNLNDVSIVYESMQGDGKYVVTVTDKVTTNNIRFYIVDIETGVVTER